MEACPPFGDVFCRGVHDLGPGVDAWPRRQTSPEARGTLRGSEAGIAVEWKSISRSRPPLDRAYSILDRGPRRCRVVTWT